MKTNLGRLQKVELREFFKDEARDFTPWLAEEENLELLSDTLGIDIELENTEVRIGKFSADIVGLDRSSNRKVIIEIDNNIIETRGLSAQLKDNKLKFSSNINMNIKN